MKRAPTPGSAFALVELSTERECDRAAFTLVELLVVITIIIALLAILMPSMGRSIEVSHRAVCASNQRQIGTHALTYAGTNFGALPDTTRYGANHDHTHWVGFDGWLDMAVGIDPDDVPVTRDLAVVSARPGERHLFCPNRLDDWKIEDRGRWGMRFGFMVLFGRYARPNNTGSAAQGLDPFRSPLRVAASKADTAITADVNEEGTAVPVIRHTSHTYSGPTYTTSTVVSSDTSMREMGSEGGNRGHVDGSVRWVFVDDMRRYWTKTWPDPATGSSTIGWW